MCLHKRCNQISVKTRWVNKSFAKPSSFLFKQVSAVVNEKRLSTYVVAIGYHYHHHHDILYMKCLFVTVKWSFQTQYLSETSNNDIGQGFTTTVVYIVERNKCIIGRQINCCHYLNTSFWYFSKLISNIAILPTGKLIIGFFVFGTLHVLLSPFIHTNLFVIVLAYGLLSMMSL